MSWISVFVKSSVAKMLWKLTIKLFMAKLGASGKALVEAAKEAAVRAELAGGTGSQKKAVVVGALKQQFETERAGILDTAAQVAWMYVDEFLKENEGNLAKLRGAAL